MEGEMSMRDKAGNIDVVVEIQTPKSPSNDDTSNQNGDSQESQNEDSSIQLKMNLFNAAAAAPAAPAQSGPPPAQLVVPSPSSDSPAKPPIAPAIRRRTTPTQSAFSKPKSRIAEPPFPGSLKPAEPTAAAATGKSSRAGSPNIAPSPSPKPTPKTSAPITPRTPLMAAVDAEDDEDDDDDDVYNTDNLKPPVVKRGKKVKAMFICEWIVFITITSLLILSLTINKLKNTLIWSLELWKLCVLVLVIFCGRLFTEWLTNFLVFLIERNFLLKKKVLYFLFALTKSVRVVLWLALILGAWVPLMGQSRRDRRTREESRILNKITRGIVSTLVGAVMWMVKTFLVKLVASTFHVKTFFDRIQESIFHQYLLQSLSGSPIWDNVSESYKNSGRLSFSKTKGGNPETKGAEVINVDKLYKIKREKVSAWTMGGLMNVIKNSDLLTVTEILDESEEESTGTKVVTSEVEAREVANRIFKRVAKHGHKYIEEEDLLRYMPKEEVDNAFPLFEGAAESKRIKKSAFRNWVVKAYNERKCLAVSLNDAKTAIEELNKIASSFVLILIVIIWILLMEIASTSVLVFIASQLLLVVFMFGNTAKTVFEDLIFVFVVHPFDVGDRCVVDGVQMVVEEMNILTTIFLKANNEKVYYPNSILATKAISNYNRSPEMMGDAIEFAVDFSTSVESLAALRAKVKGKPSMKLDVLGTDSYGKITSAVTYGSDSSAEVRCIEIKLTSNLPSSTNSGFHQSKLIITHKHKIIKGYLESKPQHWSPHHSMQVKEIVEVNKLIIALYVTHTINFQNFGETGNRKSDLVVELKKILEELGIRYRLLPQELQIRYVGGTPAVSPR